MYVPWLADAARSTGYPVVEIAGWRTRGHGGMRVVEGVVGHHTATAQSAPGDYPSLGIVTTGRSDLAGPLCNLGLGRNGTIYIVAAGCAYHAGASRWSGFTDLNDEFLGIEAESAGTGGWTDAQRDAYPKLVAALLRYMNRGVARYAGHKDVCVPAGRKIDPVGIDTQWLRDRAAHPAPTVEELMRFAEPHDLPESIDKPGRKTFAVEVGKLSEGGNSTIVEAQWLWLVSAWGGSTAYGVWVGDDHGNSIPLGSGSSPANGELQNNANAVFVIPKGARIVALSWQNRGGSLAGYSFPQITQ